MAEQRPKRVLLVEDHAQSLELQAFVLRRRGYEVVTAGTVAEAHSAASRNELDLVICDLGLPDGDGAELMRDLHERFGVYGIALSGTDRPERLEEERAGGFADHLVKPVVPDELLAAVESICR